MFHLDVYVQQRTWSSYGPLTTICNNIWLHRGWYAPYELPRTSSSSALAVELWSQAQIHFVEENKCMFSRRSLFMYNPRLTDLLQFDR
jgi:hypothetical protein